MFARVRRQQMTTWALSAAVPAVAMTLVACATNPATGKSQFSLMSEAQEIQLGKEADAQVRQEMGIYDNPELQRYVSDVGMRLARASERPNLPWQFTVVDEQAVNAFALPGGFIYITRGILPFLQNESQMAGVLGHEIGHVTARHSAQQYTKATSAGIGLTLLSVFVPEARPFEGVAESGLGLLFLKYGRNDELQADRLGVEYTAKTGWDPRGVAGMLETLQRLDAASGSSRGVPNWLSTHPDPGDRVQKVNQFLQQNPVPAGTSGAGDDSVEFDRHISGIIFGDSPKDGIVRGSQFLHPVLRLAMTFPSGWDIRNMPQQVLAKAPDRDAYLLMQLVPNASGSVEQVARTTMTQAGFRQLEGERTNVNGLDAYVGTYQGAMQGLGQVRMVAAHVVHDKRVYLLAGITPPNQFQATQADFANSIRSFRPLSASEAANIRPNRVQLYTVKGGETWQSIAQRSNGGIKPETLAIMNGYEPAQPPKSGDRIKIIVEG